MSQFIPYGKTVAVIGEGNSAATDALLFSKICNKVIVVHRRDTLRADNKVTGIKMKSTIDGTEKEICADGEI